MTKYLITGSFEVVLDTEESREYFMQSKAFFNYAYNNFPEMSSYYPALKHFVISNFCWFTERRVDNVKWREIE